MPMINIKYDDGKIQDEKIVLLADAIIKIVAEATKIPEVFAYADSPKIKVGVAPIEIFIEMSANKITNREELFQDILKKLAEWKKSVNFETPITITLTPVDWRFEIGI